MATMQILLIEDDPRMSEYLSETLSREGHFVDVCSSLGEVEAFFSIERADFPQVIILDRMLGKLDGAMLISTFKTKLPQTGILILSSLDLPSEKARILDLGADDYLAKPFSLDELTARLRLVSRRAHSGRLESSSVFGIGNLTIDLRTYGIMVGGRKLDLTKKEFQLLCLLSETPGRVFNRFQILDRIWDIERLTESNVVETTVKNLRRKLEETQCSARIESKRNIGYWVEA